MYCFLWFFHLCLVTSTCCCWILICLVWFFLCRHILLFSDPNPQFSNLHLQSPSFCMCNSHSYWFNRNFSHWNPFVSWVKPPFFGTSEPGRCAAPHQHGPPAGDRHAEQREGSGAVGQALGVQVGRQMHLLANFGWFWMAVGDGGMTRNDGLMLWNCGSRELDLSWSIRIYDLAACCWCNL
jgi:hypothetical protein